VALPCRVEWQLDAPAVTLDIQLGEVDIEALEVPTQKKF